MHKTFHTTCVVLIQKNGSEIQNSKEKYPVSVACVYNYIMKFKKKRQRILIKQLKRDNIIKQNIPPWL